MTTESSAVTAARPPLSRSPEGITVDAYALVLGGRSSLELLQDDRDWVSPARGISRKPGASR